MKEGFLRRISAACDGSNYVRSWMFDRSKLKIGCSSFDYQKMNRFKFVRCSKNNVQVRSTFDKMVFDPSLSAACRSSIKIVDDILDLGPRPM